MSGEREDVSARGGAAHYTYSFNVLAIKIGFRRPAYRLGVLLFWEALMSKREATRRAREGVERAREAAEAGQLVAKDGRRMSAAQIDNLRPGVAISDMDEAQRLEMHRAGQRASVEAQRRRRTIRDIYTDLLGQPDDLEGLEDKGLAERAQQMAQERGQGLTLYEAIAVAMAAKAKAGDVKAAVFVRDSAGDKPADNLEISAESMTADDRLLLQRVAERLKNDDAAKK